MVKEDFQCVWAVVSVMPGDGIDLCREVALRNADIVIREEVREGALAVSSEGSALQVIACNRILAAVVQKRSAHFTIETAYRCWLAVFIGRLTNCGFL